MGDSMPRKATVEPTADLETLACQTCTQLGLYFSGSLPGPGKGFKRLREAAARSIAEPGWLHIFADGRGGIAGNWKTGEKLPFFTKTWASDPLSSAVIAARKAEIKRAQAAAEKERQRIAGAAALRAAELWQRGKPLFTDHPYLKRKGVGAHTKLRQLPWGSAIMAPIENAAGELRSLQFIAADGSRRFLRDGEIAGNFCLLAASVSSETAETILICEGVATGLTLHEGTKLPVACALSCNNLAAAANTVRQRFPAIRIVICGDDDWQIHKPIENPGASAARKAAEAVDGIMMLPRFVGRDRKREDTDFNDMAATSGLAAVRQLFDGVDTHHGSAAGEAKVPEPLIANRCGEDLDGIAGRYRSHDGRIVWDQDGGGEPIQLANFAAKIVAEITVDDGAARSRRLEIAWRLRDRRGSFQIPAREFASLQWPMPEIGAAAIVAPGHAQRDRLRAAIQYLSGDVHCRQIYAQTGWREHDGRWAYLHNGGAIGATGVSTELRN
jgi:putative DNA primase/helicase